MCIRDSYEGDITKESDDYKCPICTVPKEMFELVKEPATQAPAEETSTAVSYTHLQMTYCITCIILAYRKKAKNLFPLNRRNTTLHNFGKKIFLICSS